LKGDSRRKGGKYRNAVVALFATTGRSQYRIVRYVAQSFIFQPFTNFLAHRRIRLTCLIGDAARKNLPERSFGSRASWGRCFFMFAENADCTVWIS
jgi:hypothetical protein